MKKIFLIGLCILLGVTSQAQNTIDLSGEWEFSMDRNDVGEKEKWFASTLDDRINLPGSMPEKLKGDIVTASTQWTGSIYDSSYYYSPYMEKYRKEGNVKYPFFLTPARHYVGAAWYKKEVEIPAGWKGKRIILHLERPHIETTVWVNGKKAGSCNSLSVAHEYDLTGKVQPGKCILAVKVDNRIKADYNVGMDSHSVTDQTQGNWNGIVGDMYLEALPTVYLEDIQVYPDIEHKQARVRITVQGSGQASVKLSAQSFNTTVSHNVPPIQQDIRLKKGENKLEMTLPMGEDMLLWDEFSPALYRLHAELSSPAGTDVREVEFGMRSFEIKGKWFYVNGRKTQLRGTVENCVFPLTGYAPTDEESWEKIFNICKTYGLNHVRFHSYCPPEAAFRAADRTGFYLQPEGPSWPNHGVSLGNGEPIDTYLMKETQAIVKHYGNYASFCMLACGNEPYGNWVAWVSKFVDYWKQTDPRRVYTGASVGNGWQWQPRNQYHVKAGARGLTWNKRRPSTDDDYRFQNHLDTVRQPYVAHEMGQWCAFPNFNEIGKYTGVNKALNFEIFRDLLAENDMADRAYWFMMASGKLQALCYKYELEKMRRTPDYAGFQLLSLNDYSGQGTALVGVLDAFFEEKGYLHADEWRRFCAPTVPLMRTQKFVWNADETFEADIEISHFGASACDNAQVSYTLRDEYGTLYNKGVFPVKSLDLGLNSIGHVACPLAAIDKPRKLNLEVKIEGTDVVNDWNIWVYPVPETVSEGKVYVTDSLDTKALDILQAGGNVLITAAGKISYGKEIKQDFTPVFWNTSWFKMRPPHTTGILVNPHHPLFQQFPTDYHSDLQWWELLNRAQVMQFTDFPTGFQPLVQSIDTWFISRKAGMLFEANVLNGKLMMTSMDLSTGLDERIVARQMRKAILDYMNSDSFRPQHEVSPQQISDLFQKVTGEVNMYTRQSPDELKPTIK